MTPAARLSAAIEIVADIEARHRPAADALKDWGLSHRFAGSGDRAAIAGLVYDALRRRASSIHVMGDPSPRAVLLGMLRLERKLEPDAIAALANGGRFAPQPLSADERARLAAPDLEGAPPWVAGDYPEWLDPYLARVFGEERAAEGAALASRAPLDLRVNDIKGERDDAAALLADLNPVPTRWSPFGLRIALEADAKNPAIHAEPAFIKGMVEVQDEGSQLAALLAGAKPGEHVVDLCAGAGGKTLALAAAMHNQGQLYATDTDKRRLAPIHERLARCRRAQRAGPHAEVRRHRACRSRGPRRPRAHRRALHRHRNVAAQSRCQVARASRRARGAAQGAGGRARPRRARWSSPAVASRMSPARCWRRRTAIRSAHFSRAETGFALVPPGEVANALGERAYLFRRAALMSDGGTADDPAPHRHRRILRLGAGADLIRPTRLPEVGRPRARLGPPLWQPGSKGGARRPDLGIAARR